MDAARLEARYDAWVRHHYARIYNLLVRLSGDAVLAEDLTQETFEQVWRALPQFDGRSRPGTWIHSIAVNVWRQHARRQSHEALPLDEQHDPPDERPGPPELAERGGRFARAAAALATLPESYREVLVLAKVQGLSQREVAAALELPLGTVKWRIWKGLEMLRARLAGEIEDEP